MVISEYPDRGETKTREDFESDASYLYYLEKHIQYINFKQRLQEYDKYLQIKREVREKRNETQVLLQSNKGEDERFKSS